MKTFVALILMTSSISAMADTFMCDMKVGQFQTRSAYAEPYGRLINIVMGEYSCEGTIDNDIIVTTTVASNITGESNSVSRYSSSSVEMMTLDIWGDGQVRLECSCSLN